jgi:hypothetical protein
MKQFVFGFIVFALGVGWVSFLVFDFSGSSLEELPKEQRAVFREAPKNDTSRSIVVMEEKTIEEALNLEQSVLLDVPFTPQAPMRNWHLDEYQYACEEASLAMAMYWVKGKELTQAKAERELLEVSKYQFEKTGNFYDTSARDTAQLMRDYYKYDAVEVRADITADDIKEELLRGNLVIAPINADIITNPHYVTLVGAHMLVVKGYDAATKEFITNDPGTKMGEGFRYPAAVFEEGIRDYNTGKNILITRTEKRIIVVKPQKSVL